MIEDCTDLLQCEKRLSEEVRNVSLLGQIALSPEDMERIQAEPPDIFPSPVEAIRWGMDQVANDQPVFKDEAHAQNAYDKVKRERRPQTAREMRDAGVEEVMGRKELPRELDVAA